MSERDSPGDQGVSAHPDEEATVRAFFAKDLRRRILDSLDVPRRREREWERLWKYDQSAFRYATPVPGRARFPDTIYGVLKAKGASDTCYVMGNTPFDQQTLDLKTVLEEHLDAPWDTIISCIAGRLAYLHTHESYRDDYLLEKPAVVSP